MEDNALVWFYRLLLRLYPTSFRERLGDEMIAVFAQTVDDARRQGGGALAGVVLRELLHFPGSLLLAYAESWRQPEPVPVSAPSWLWIGGWTLLSVTALPLAWFLAAPLGFLVLLLLQLIPGLPLSSSVAEAIGGMAAVGLATGVAQWTLLRHRLPGAGWWIPLTFAGWLAGGLLVFLVTVLIDRPIGPGLPFALLGTCVGLGQWLLLRRFLRGGSWWLLASFFAGGLVILAGETFDSIPELLIFVTLPYLLTGAFLWLLLQRGSPTIVAGEDSKTRPDTQVSPARLPGRARLLLLVLPLLVVLLGACPWVYAVSQLELAKREGIYDSPTDAMRARVAAVEGVRVVRVEMLSAGPAARDQSRPHVWFAGANVLYDRPHPFSGQRREAFGSYYIRVEEGWVHVPEGAFPPLIGRIMELYHLEGVGTPIPEPLSGAQATPSGLNRLP